MISFQNTQPIMKKVIRKKDKKVREQMYTKKLKDMLPKNEKN